MNKDKNKKNDDNQTKYSAKKKSSQVKQLKNNE